MDSTFGITLGILAGSLVGLSWFAGSDAPFVPTKMNKIKSILEKAGIKKGSIFYELGSGDGRVVFEAAKLGAKSIGVEQSLIRVLLSKFLAKKYVLPSAHFIHGNIFDQKYSDADFFYIYLLPKGIDKLEKKLQSELQQKKDKKRKVVIITQTYHFQNLKPYEKIDNFNLYKI